jgi:hypothetical protein
MSSSRIGGILIVISAALFALTLAIAAWGGSVSVRGEGPGSVTATAALILLGAGLLILAIAGRPPLDGRTLRFGFGLVVIGGAAELLTADVPVESLLVIVFLLGGMVALIGIVVSGIGLLVTPGAARRVGLGFVAGIALVALAGWVSNDPGIAFSPQTESLRVALNLVAIVAAAILIVSLAAVGILAIRSVAEPVATPGARLGRMT